MKRMKQFLAIFLCAAMLITPCNQVVMADQNVNENNQNNESIEQEVTEETESEGIQKDTEEVEDTEKVQKDTEEVEDTEKVQKDIEEVEDTEVQKDTEEVEDTEVQKDTEDVEDTKIQKHTKDIEEPELVEDKKDTELAEQSEEEKEHKKGGYIPLPNQKDAGVLTSTDGDGLEIYQSAALPKKYKTERLTTVKDQNPYGTCWAFGSTVLAETSVLKKNPSIDTSAIDLSELQLVYFANHSVKDPLGGTDGDSNVYTNPDVSYLDNGGNYIFSMQTYANWVGASDEKKVPYEKAEDVLANGLDSKFAYDDSAHMIGAYKVNISADRDNAKRLLMEYGALGISFYVDYDSYNEETNSYYNPETEVQDHSVTIVGWDDTYPKENFNIEPEADGAWLVRNSWGDNSDSLDGYFWMSYYEETLESTAYAFSFAEKGNAGYYENNYQYDGSESSISYTNGTNQVIAANVFKSKKANEQLKAVSFISDVVNQQYTIDIYANLSNKKNPESGRLVQSLQGKTTYEGLYTVELDKNVYFQKGDIYAVVVSLTKQNEQAAIAAENTIVLDDWMTCTASSKAGQSFVKEQNGKWKDYGADGNGNIRIKAYTNKIKNPTPVKSVSILASEKKVGVGGELRLCASVSPANATNQKIIWTSADKSIASVDAKSGVVKGKKAGKVKITATTADGSKKASVTVKVDKAALIGITLNSSEKKIHLGEKAKLSVNYNPSDTKDDKTVTWTSSNKKVAKVNNKGVVKGCGYGIATITAKVGKYKASCKVEVNPDTVSFSVVGNNKGNKATIKWKSVEKVDGYLINKLKFENGKFCGTEYVETALPETTSYVDTDVNLKKYDYYYYISAYSAPSEIEYYESPTMDLQAVKYKITYELKGGKNHKKNPKYITYEQYSSGKKIKLNHPTRKGYTFVGWYRDKKYTKKVTSLKGCKKNITLYAKWKKD